MQPALQEAVAKREEALASEGMFRKFFDVAPDAMVVVTKDGRIRLVNAQAEKAFGYARAEIIDQWVEILLPERFRSKHGDRTKYFNDPKARAMGFGLELHGLRRDGTEFPIEICSSRVELEDGSFVGAIRDITERKNADHARFRLAAIVDSSHDAIVSETLDGVITSWNRGAQRIFGFTAEQAVGQPIALLVPEGGAQLELEPASVERLARGELGEPVDAVRRRKDGSLVEVSVTISPVLDASGHQIGLSKVARDITDRKRHEGALARARDDAESANRELEAFSYSVAHDLRAPLRGMNGFAQVLLDTYRDKLDADGQDWLEEICLNAKRMGGLIDGLLGLSRVSRTELREVVVDLSAIVRMTASHLARSEPDRDVVEVVVEKDVRAVLDAQLARALVENLMSNAWKFTSKTPSPRIEFGVTESKGRTAFFVRDNGAGFDVAFADKLFSPFQRLHTVTEFPGTGVGLATVQRIVHRHGGHIWAEGAVGRGATFYFTLRDRASGATS